MAVYYASRIGMGAAADIREAVHTRVPSYSVGHMNHFGTASLITRNTCDIQQMQLFFLMALTMMVKAHRLSTMRDVNVIIVMERGPIVERVATKR